MLRKLPTLSVVQMCSSHNKAENLQTCKALVTASAKQGAQFICLPEALDYISSPEVKPTPEPVDGGPIVQEFQRLAKSLKVWLSLGGLHEEVPGDSRICNTHCVINSDGQLVAQYRKMHLFDVNYDGGFVESDSTLPGEELVVVRDTPIGDVGLTTCYDVRFPEMFALLQHAGADVILVPSAFMPTTGAAHWEVLLRARAIETQCYVAAAAQCGPHNSARSSYGHSLIVDPFGKVLVDLGSANATHGLVEIDRDLIAQVRHRMPIAAHRDAASIDIHARSPVTSSPSEDSKDAAL